MKKTFWQYIFPLMMLTIVSNAILITSCSASISEVKFYDNFDKGFTESSNWIFWCACLNHEVTLKAPVIDEDADDGKVLQLIFPNSCLSQGPINGPNVESKKRFSYGTYVFRLKAAQCSRDEGVVTGFFIYWQNRIRIDRNRNGIADLAEIDFEILGAEPNALYMSIWTDYEEGVGQRRVVRKVNISAGKVEYTRYYTEWENWEETGGEPEGIPAISRFNSTKNYYEYGFIWTPNSVTFFIRDPETCENMMLWNYKDATHIPKTPAKIMLNVWHTDDWTPERFPEAVSPPSKNAVLRVDWVSYSSLR